LFVAQIGFSQSFFTQSYPVGAGPAQVIVADFNGDHIPDLATANNLSNTVSILINNGDGTFRPAMEFATGPAPVGLAAVDWNKDGKMDLVVVNSGADAAHSVSILLGNGDGTFKPHHDIPGAPNGNSIAAGDFNRDGNPDIATSSNSPINAVYVSLGNGHGGVLAQKVTSGFGEQAPPGADPFIVTKIARADFNRDGKDDLYYVECCGGFDIHFGAWGVLVGKGDGTFADDLLAPDASPPGDVIATDINQDGFSDIMVPFICVHDFCEGVGASINNGKENFSGGAFYQINGDVPGTAAFDVNGDGLKDVIMLSADFSGSNFPTTMNLFIGQQNADGTFASSPVTVPLNAPLPDGPTQPVVVGDFNHDGKLDLAFIQGVPFSPGIPYSGPNLVWVVLNTTPPSPCQERTSDHTVTLCHPSDGAVLSSPVHIVARATSSTPVQATQIYLDNRLIFQTSGGNLDKSLPLAPGTHKLEVKSWSEGKDFRNDFSVTAIGTRPATAPPCTESTDFAVNICSPGQSANVNSPVPVVAAAKSTAHITTMQIYVDGKLVFHSPNSSLIETDMPMVTGMHRLTVKAWDSSGKNFSSTRTISVQ
jgi:hypothetical protein